MSRRLAGGLALLVVAASPAAAQDDMPWAASYYPYVVKGPNDKLSLVLHYQYAQNADYYDAVPFAKSFSAEAGANADGGRFLVARFKGPRIAPGWRLFAEAGAVREARFGYYGLGNDTEEIDDPDNPYATRIRRNRYYAQVDGTRHVAGPLQVFLGGGIVRAEYSALPGASVAQGDCFGFMNTPTPQTIAAQPAGDCSGDTDAWGRLGFAVDTRDREMVTSRGVLLEAGVFAGSGGDGYSGLYGIAQGFVSPREGLVLGARALGRAMSDGAPLDARYRMPAWERDIPTLGGPYSHRSFIYGRYTGRHVLLGNLEARQDILNFGDYGAITAVGFLDAGRVHEGVPEESDDLHVGGGGGLALRILRSTVLTFNFAGGPDGFLFSMGTGWAF